MGLMRDVTDLFGATGLAVAGYALPITLALLGTVSPSIPADGASLPDHTVEMSVVRVTIADALDDAGEVVTHPSGRAEPQETQAEPVRMARVASNPERTVTRKVESAAEPSGTSEAPEVAIAAPVPSESKKKPCEPRTDDIVRVGSSSFAIDKELVSYFGSHPAKLGSLAYVKRSEGTDGKVVGYKLGGIKCGTELHLAGLRNGDVVRSVNGHKVTSITDALLTYARLKNDEVIELVVERKGALHHLTYRIG